MIQLAKDAGLKVIASAGSDDKVAYMKSIGADVAFNYKTTKTAEVLKKEGPINMSVTRFSFRPDFDSRQIRFWDNVGGETFEAAIEYAANGARFLVIISNHQYWMSGLPCEAHRNAGWRPHTTRPNCTP